MNFPGDQVPAAACPPPMTDTKEGGRRDRLGQQRAFYDYMKPGLRGRYWVQFPKSLDDISIIGTVIRILCSTAALKAASQGLGINADTCGEVPPAGRF